MRIRTLALASIALTAAGLGAVAAPAQAAAPSGQSAPDKPVHCVASVATGKASCFESFTEAIAKATGGRVTDAPKDAATVVHDPAFAAKLDGSRGTMVKGSGSTKATDGASIQSVVIEIDFDYGFFGTDTFTWTAPSGCETNPLGNVKYLVYNLSDYGWNDRINAYDNYSLCYSNHFEHANFGGASTGWRYGNHSLGVLDGQISSIQWS